MGIIIIWVIIGLAASIAFTSFLSGRGSGGSTVVNVIAGVVGGLMGGYAGMFAGALIIGPGPAFLFSFLGAAALAVAAVLIASKIKM